MKQDQFFTLLNNLIIRTGLSKNSLIRDTGIDRSTFFQILGGKRLPTNRQLGNLIATFSHDASHSELTQLLEAFLPLRMVPDRFQSWKSIQQFIHQVNESLNSTENTYLENSQGTQETDPQRVAVMGAILAFLQGQSSTVETSIDFYLPSSLLEAFQIDSLMAGYLQPGATIRQIIGTDQNNPQTTIDTLLRNIARMIKILTCTEAHLYIYPAEDSPRGKQAQLFPYYLMSSDALLLISADGRATSMTYDTDLISAFHNRFNEAIQGLDPLFTSVDDYTALSRLLFARHQKLVQEGSMMVVTDRPCTLQLLSDRFVDRYIANKEFVFFAKAYIHIMQAIPNFCAMMSEEGLQQFQEDRFISESGINIHLSDADLQEMMDKEQKILGKRQLIVPFDHVFIHGWEVAVYSDQEAFLSLHASTDCVIRFRNKDIGGALYAYYDSIRQILQE